MLIIKHIVKQMTEELHDAEKYAEDALKYKTEMMGLADVYYKLANQELEHSAALHDQAVNIIRAYGKEPPTTMQAIWDWQHEQMIEQEKEVRLTLSMYRK